MEGFLLFFEEQQTWIYLTLFIIGVIHLRLLIIAFRASRRAFFSLERERILSRIRRSIAMILLVLAGFAATFLIVNFASPAIPISLRPTALPTVSLLSTPDDLKEPLVAGSNGVVEVVPASVDGAGCLNENATIIQPEDGESVSGTIVILGVANIPNFAFYKVEYRRLNSEWVAITAGSQPVCETCRSSDTEVDDSEGEMLELGTWDTSLVEPGLYGFRLVVMDTEGNAPLPCEIQIQILPAE